jgi:citrate synthase
MANFDLLTARQAAERLGIKLDTLYAYVSRRRLQSVSLPGSRERRYRVEDVEALLATREGERPARSPESEALLPVISSTICLNENTLMFY